MHTHLQKKSPARNATPKSGAGATSAAADENPPRSPATTPLRTLSALCGRNGRGSPQFMISTATRQIDHNPVFRSPRPGHAPRAVKAVDRSFTKEPPFGNAARTENGELAEEICQAAIPWICAFSAPSRTEVTLHGLPPSRRAWGRGREMVGGLGGGMGCSPLHPP